MGNALQFALSNPTAGMEDAFNAWYAGPHLQHGVETPGILSGQRFRRVDGPWRNGIHDYLMLWEMDDPASTLAELAKVKGTEAMPISPAINMSTVQPPTFWRRAEIRNASRPLVDSTTFGSVVLALFNAEAGADQALADALLSGGLRSLADRDGVAGASYLTLADEQIRGNCRKYPHGLLIELADEAAGIAALGDDLGHLPHADAERWMAIVFRPMDRRVCRTAHAATGETHA